MPIEVQFWLLFVAVVINIGITLGTACFVIKHMGDLEKFGRLLRKLRRHVKAGDKVVDG